jgi:hypothetical protein
MLSKVITEGTFEKGAHQPRGPGAEDGANDHVDDVVQPVPSVHLPRAREAHEELGPRAPVPARVLVLGTQFKNSVP